MNTAQNYCTPCGCANPVVPTAQQASSAVDSSPQTDNQPSESETFKPQSSITCRLSLLGDPYRDSAAAIVLWALRDYREDKYRTLVREMSEVLGESDWAAAGGALSEIQVIDELSNDIALQIQEVASHNYRAAYHYAEPGSTRSEEGRNEESADKYHNSISKLVA